MKPLKPASEIANDAIAALAPLRDELVEAVHALEDGSGALRGTLDAIDELGRKIRSASTEAINELVDQSNVLLERSKTGQLCYRCSPSIGSAICPSLDGGACPTSDEPRRQR